MRAKDLDTLEFKTLLDEVAKHAASSAGRGACRQLRPILHANGVRNELTRVSDLHLLMEEEPLGLGDFPDIRTHVAASRTIGARLSGADLLEVAGTLAAIRQMRGYLRANATGRPLLQRSMASLHALPELDRRLSETLDEEGNLRDDASPALRAVRRELRELRGEIENRLGRLFRQSSADRLFAEQYVTLRNGRFVVPVRSQTQSELPGIVQDRSSSGETLFVEPLFAVEPNNRLLIAAREEAEEESRILMEITRMVGDLADALEEAFGALVDLDTVAARARFAAKHGAVCPEVGEPGSAVSLKQARHPLLVLTGRTVTPIDLDLAPNQKLLVLTGPNTGGKSVALKTLGLSALMAQTGIPVLAAPGAALPLFDGVWTDIGDQQNVAGDLSTFSGHVQNLGEILEASTHASLALLDEPGTGTDPEDGAALARVLLQTLTARGTRVLATTHFQTVKVFALNSEGATVATVDFDPETFSPRYRLVYGSIGPSLGLDMARRLGLPRELVVRAEAERGELAQNLGDAVTQLEAERRRYEEESDKLSAKRRSLRKVEGEHEALVQELKDKKKKKWAEELGEAKRFAEELKSEGRRLLAQARRDPKGSARRVHQAGLEQSARVEARRQETVDDRPAPPTSPATALSPGDEVEIVGNGVRGTLVKIAGNRAQVARGAIRFDVPSGQLRRLGGPSSKPKRVRGPSHALRRASDESEDTSSSIELNLVGARVSRALERLESFLDRAALDGQTSVRIVHGHGSGALRSAVREYLADSPYVARYEDADGRTGGTGATIARLR